MENQPCPTIRTLAAKKLVGFRRKMSLADNKTSELWRSFLTRRHEIPGAVGTDLYSLQIYDDKYFAPFSPMKEFEKWAAVEVADFDRIPDGMERLSLGGGLYAVFPHKGAAATAPKAFQYILGTWLPSSPYVLDSRPHFEQLGDRYKNDDPDSEEEIWIPVRKKGSP